MQTLQWVLLPIKEIPMKGKSMHVHLFCWLAQPCFVSNYRSDIKEKNKRENIKNHLLAMHL